MGHTGNAVIKLSEQISNDFKALYYDIAVNNPTVHKIDVIIGSLKVIKANKQTNKLYKVRETNGNKFNAPVCCLFQQLQEQFFELNLTLTYTNHELTPTSLHNQEVLNTTATILTLMQNLNENINIIIDKLNNHYYRSYPETFEPEDKNNPIDFSKKILLKVHQNTS